MCHLQGVKVIPALQAVAIGLAIRFLAPIPAGISPQVTQAVLSHHSHMIDLELPDASVMMSGEYALGPLAHDMYQ